MGDWLWPAIWLIPSFQVYGTWPRSGEIDMMESRGNQILMSGTEDIGINQFGATLNFGTQSNNSAWRTAHFTRNKNNGWNNGFHLYQMVWGPGIM